VESRTEQFTLPPVAAKILVWHQGALGDVLLAGPALKALSGHYPGARFTLVGGPEQLGLFTATLPVEGVWNAHRAIWLDLFQDHGPIDTKLKNLLSQFDLAFVFSPQRQLEFLNRFRLAGIPHLFWVPSFPVEARMSVRQVQGEILQRGGIKPREFFRLIIPDSEYQPHSCISEIDHLRIPLVALAPGSGHPLKNWPLDSYAELARILEEQYRAQVWWVVGPAEARLLSDLQRKFPSQELRLFKDMSLGHIAATLAGFQLFVGNDSGITHLAAALAQPRVVALFGPSDPLIWAPSAHRTTIITSSQECAPCTEGREIRCPDNICMSSITPEKILAVISKIF
jgi:ADP-heptose:LPS heptosyltransferase